MEVTWEKNQGKTVMRIKAGECTGLVIDIQERLFPVIHGHNELLVRVLVLLEGLKILGIPLLLTEQYPKGLGPTVQKVLEVLDNSEALEKISFSCCGEPDFLTRLKENEKKRVIICGIEAHVCVLQSVLDLLELGFTPVVVADCISSRNHEDKKLAIERMRSEGAIISTSESILFELTERAGNDQFKQISRLIK